MVKNLPTNAGYKGDVGLIPGLGRSPEEGNNNPPQCPWLENLRRRSLVATVHGAPDSDMLEHTHISNMCLLAYQLGGDLVTKLCPTSDCSPPGSSVHGYFPSKNTGVGCHFLLQGIFLTQPSNLCLLYLLHWLVDSSPLCYWEGPGRVLSHEKGNREVACLYFMP